MFHLHMLIVRDSFRRNFRNKSIRIVDVMVAARACAKKNKENRNFPFCRKLTGAHPVTTPISSQETLYYPAETIMGRWGIKIHTIIAS